LIFLPAAYNRRVTLVAGLDLRAFAAAHPRLAEAYLRQQERLGCVRPSWRFAWVTSAGGIVARVVYWGLPGAVAPCLIDVAIGDESAIADLLAASLARLGVTTIDYQPTRPLGAGRGVDEPAALEANGFALIATQQRLLHSGPPPRVPVMPGVELPAVHDLGLETLVPLVATVRSATSDRATAARPDPTAEVTALHEAAHDPRWWTVAIDDGVPVGFVLPIRTDGGPVIADIGVVPEARRRGIGRLLLAHGTAVVIGETGRVGADVDDGNAAMLATAFSVGYVAVAARAHWVRTAASAP
jgi:GNAT superfamily N-acetyltransferase